MSIEPESQPERKPSAFASLIAGSVGGACQVVVGQPLDTVRVRAQIAPPGKFKGPMDICMQTVRNEGFLALYKGMLSPLVGIASVNALLFGAYTASRRMVSPYPDPPLHLIALSGAMAGTAQAALASPVEMFKVRMQAQYGRKGDLGTKTLGQVASEMWKDYGFRQGVMRGYWITVAREIPAYAAFYTGFEWSKRSISARLNPHLSSSSLAKPEPLPVWALLLSGSVGGLGYWTACYPLDVVKSRVQMAERPPIGISYLWEDFRIIYRQEGMKAFFRGLSPTYLRTIPSAAATFAAYELTMTFLKTNTSL